MSYLSRLRLLLFPRDCSGNRSPVFLIDGFPPAAGIDVVMEHHARRPIRAAWTGADVVEYEDGGVACELHRSRDRKFHLLIAHGEHGHDRPLSVLFLLR